MAGALAAAAGVGAAPLVAVVGWLAAGVGNGGALKTVLVADVDFAVREDVVT